MKIVAVDPGSCVACRNCEYTCAFQRTGDFDRNDSNIRVSFFPEERVCIPWTCLHCGEPFCLEVCPAGAIGRNPDTGAVEIDPERCAGCKMCLLACPFGNIHFDSGAGVARKCDLCGGEPRCVRFCTSGALRFTEAGQAFEFHRQDVELRLKRILELQKRLGRE